MLDDERAKRVLDRMKISLDAHSEVREDNRNDWELYMAYRNDPDYPWQSNLMLPVVFDAVETLLPHLVSDRFVIDAVPGVGADPRGRETWKALMAYNSRKMRLTWKLVNGEKQALIYGWSPYMVDWLFDVRLSTVRRFETLFAGTPFETSVPITEQVPMVKYDGPNLQFIDPFQVFLQPNKAEVNSETPGKGMDWAIVRMVVPMKWLEARRDLLVDETDDLGRDVIQQLRGTDFPEHAADTQQELEERQDLLGINQAVVDNTVDQVELLVMFGDRGPNEAEDGVQWIGNREVVLRDEGSPFWHHDIPIGIINDIPLPNSPFGLGEARIAESFQLEKSDIRNARLDNMHQVINRMWMVLNNAGIDDAELVSRPGGIVHADRLGSIEALNQNEQFFSTFQEERMLEEDIEKTLGSLATLRGRFENNLTRTTATGNQMMAEFATARVRIKALSLFHQGLTQIGQWIIALEQQFTARPKLLRVQSGGVPEDITVNPQEIAGEWTPEPVIDQALPSTKARRRQDATVMLQSLAPLAQAGVVVDQLVLEFLEAYDVSDPERFLVSSQQQRAAAVDPDQLAAEALDAVISQQQGAQQAQVPAELLQAAAG